MKIIRSKGLFAMIGEEEKPYVFIDKSEEYRKCLEEINLILDELKQQYDYMTDYSEIKEIQNKINEVLGND